MVEARLALEPFDPAEELRAFTDDLTGDGAVVSFTGVARDTTKGGHRVTGMLLDHHPRLTQASLNSIGADASARFAVSAVRIVHRCGAIAPREAIVFAAAAALHRRAAFDAVDYLIDRLKTDAMFWKREDSEGEAEWIEPTGEDHAARARWEP